MAIAEGVSKVFAYKEETSWAVAPGATSGILLGRVTATGDLNKATYESAEIETHRQVSDFRHGTRSAAVAYNGELCAGRYAPFFAAGLQQTFQTAPTTGALTNVTAAATTPHFTRATGSFLTDGFKVGDVVRWTGWAAGATANNNKNFLITTLTALQMTVLALDGSAVVAKAAGDSVTCTLAGKRTWVPTTGHTDKSFWLENWYPDVAQSEQFSGCKLQNINIQLPATGIATCAMNFLGKDMVTGTSQYFTSPAAPTQSGKLAAVNGVVILGSGQSVGVTGLSLALDFGLSSDTVVGSNVSPSIYRGRVRASVDATVLFEDAAMRDAFVNETIVKVIGAFTASTAANADFVTFVLPSVKMGAATKTDGERGIAQTLRGIAIKSGAAAGSDTLDTTIVIQDSLAT